MTTWLEKFLAPDLLEAYSERGYALNFGYTVSTDSINPEDPAKGLVAAFDLDGLDDPLARADTVHTLRFPLLPTDTVYPAMGGTADEEHAVARGDFLELSSFNGNGIVALPSDLRASRLHADPTVLRAGARILRRESRGATTEAVATYRGLFVGWKKPNGTKTPSGSPDPFSMQAFRIKETDSFSPGQFNFSEDGSLHDVIGLHRDDNDAQRHIVIELNRIAQTGVMKVRGAWDGIPVRAIRIIEDGKRWEIMSLTHGAHVAQERGVRHVEAGVYGALVAPHETLTTFTLLSVPSWPRG